MIKSARTAKGLSFAFAGLLVAAPIGATASAASATGNDAAPFQMAQEAAQQQYSDTELESYAKAVVEIQEVNQKWQTEMNAAQTQEEADAIREQSFTEMEGVVEDNGLTVQQYNDITVAAQSDPDLNQKILAMINEEAGQ